MDKFTTEYSSHYLKRDTSSGRINVFRNRNGYKDIMAIFLDIGDMENAFVLMGRYLKSKNSDIFEKSAE
jgi:hypothetical protein